MLILATLIRVPRVIASIADPVQFLGCAGSTILAILALPIASCRLVDITCRRYCQPQLITSPPRPALSSNTALPRLQALTHNPLLRNYFMAGKHLRTPRCLRRAENLQGAWAAFVLLAACLLLPNPQPPLSALGTVSQTVLLLFSCMLPTSPPQTSRLAIV